MPKHRDSNALWLATLRWAKFGPPRRGCRMKPLGQRPLAWTDYRSALRKAPCRDASCGNHGGSIWVGKTLGHKLINGIPISREV